MTSRTAAVSFTIALAAIAAPLAQACDTSAKGWRVLFDGSSLKDWRGYKSDSVPSGWKEFAELKVAANTSGKNPRSGRASGIGL